MFIANTAHRDPFFISGKKTEKIKEGLGRGELVLFYFCICEKNVTGPHAAEAQTDTNITQGYSIERSRLPFFGKSFRPVYNVFP